MLPGIIKVLDTLFWSLFITLIMAENPPQLTRSRVGRPAGRRGMGGLRSLLGGFALYTCIIMYFTRVSLYSHVHTRDTWDTGAIQLRYMYSDDERHNTCILRILHGNTLKYTIRCIFCIVYVYCVFGLWCASRITYCVVCIVYVYCLYAVLFICQIYNFGMVFTALWCHFHAVNATHKL